MYDFLKISTNFCDLDLLFSVRNSVTFMMKRFVILFKLSLMVSMAPSLLMVKLERAKRLPCKVSNKSYPLLRFHLFRQCVRYKLLYYYCYYYCLLCYQVMNKKKSLFLSETPLWPSSLMPQAVYVCLSVFCHKQSRKSKNNCLDPDSGFS